MLPVVLGPLRFAVMCSRLEESVLVEEPERPVIGPAESLRGFDNLLQNRLKAGIVGDCAKDAADRALLLMELLEPTGKFSVVTGNACHARSLSRRVAVSVSRSTLLM